MAWHLNSYHAALLAQTPPSRERLDAEARAAVAKLLEWCRSDPTTNPPLLGSHRYSEQLDLEAALEAALPLMQPRPHRQLPWFNVAATIWSAACHQLKTIGRTGGSSAGSAAIRFTARSLERLGHGVVTADQVASAIRTHWLPTQSPAAPKGVG